MSEIDVTDADRERADFWCRCLPSGVRQQMAEHFAAHRIAERKAEREQIVAWIRQQAGFNHNESTWTKIADELERQS